MNPPNTASLRERLGRKLRSWRPWPDLVVYGGGGVALLVSTVFWPDAASRFEFWVKIGLGLLLVMSAGIELYSFLQDRAPGGRNG